MKSLCERIFGILGLTLPGWNDLQHPKLDAGLSVIADGEALLEIGMVTPALLKQFDCRQELLFADLRWDPLMVQASLKNVEFRELPRQLPVHRDLAMIVARSLPFERVEKAAIRN